MHELSIVMGIIEIASGQMENEPNGTIDEIELEIGRLTTIEDAAFEFAWKQGIKNTLLEHSLVHIIRPDGKAVCMDCSEEFAIQNLYDSCPACGSHFIHIQSGKELRVKSLVVS